MKNRNLLAFAASVILAIAASLMLATASLPALAADAPKPLYERLGGLKGITNKNLAIDAGRHRSPAPYLKFQVSQLVCEVTGGPCKYTGKGMKESHVPLNISEKEWGVMAGEFKKSLDKFKVPAAEQKELFDIVGKTKADIVTRP
jgi:hemoglobin